MFPCTDPLVHNIPMRSSRAVSVAFAAMVSMAAAVLAADKSSDTVTYKWYDEKGNPHYGDSVPPQYSKRERAVLNEEGVEVRRIEAEKTPEEAAADAVRQKALSARRQRDQFLLTTYTSVADIEALRDQRIEQIQGQSSAAEQYIETLNSRLAGLQARAQLFKPYSPRPEARQMPDVLAEDLVRTLNELRSQKNIMIAKSAEREAVMKDFQTDIDRYRELRTPTARR